MTQPSYRKPLILASTLIVVSSAVYWFEFSKKPADLAAESAQKKAFPLKDASIRKISLYRPDQTVVLICRNAKDDCKSTSNTQWDLEEPLKTKADPSSAQSLLTNLLGMGGADVVSLQEESPESRKSLLTSYRLDEAQRKAPSARTVTVETDDGDRWVTYLGEASPTSSSTYSLSEKNGKANEERVFLLPKYQIAALDQSLVHWRDKRIVSLAAPEIQSFELEWKGTKLRGQKNNGSWEVTDGKAKAPGDVDAVDTFLTGLVFLNANGFAAEKKNSAEGKSLLRGLAPEATIRFAASEEKGRSQTLRLYSKAFKDGKKSATIAYATVDEMDPIFQVDSTSLTRAQRKLTDLRMKKLIGVPERTEIRALRFEVRGKGAYLAEAEFQNGEWKRRGTGKPLQHVNVNALLDRLSSDVVRDFLPAQSPGQPSLRLQAGPSADQLKREWIFWKSGKIVFARAENSTEIFRLADGAGEVIPFEEKDLTESKARLAPKTPLEIPPESGEDHHGHAH